MYSNQKHTFSDSWAIFATLDKPVPFLKVTYNASGV